MMSFVGPAVERKERSCEEGHELAKDMHGGTEVREREEGKNLKENEDRKEWEAWRDRGACL